MARLETVHAKDLTADGRLKRKYEIEEVKGSNALTLASVAGIVIGAFLAIKTVLFGWMDGSSAQAAQTDSEPQNLAPKKEDDIAESDAAVLKEKPSDGNEEDQEALDFQAKTSFASAFKVFPQEDYSQISNAISAVNGSSARSSAGGAESQSAPGSNLASSNVVVFPGGGQSAAGSDTSNTGTQIDRADDDDLDLDEPEDDRPSKPLNRLPIVTAPVILNEMFVNQSIVIFMADLLRQAQDPDGDELRVANLKSSSGQIKDNGDGSWTFTPDAYDRSNVTFSYDITDDEGVVQQFAELDIVSLPGQEIEGTNDAEVISGSAGRDRITALDGDDVVVARDDSDFVDGGAGDDTILGGEGDDVIYGGSGDDIIYGGLGDDVVFGGEGDDTIEGDEGDDRLFGEEGDDLVSGGAGDDQILGGIGADELHGDAGNDFLGGDSGADLLLAGAGDDVIIGGEGADRAEGGSGNDIFIARLGDSEDNTAALDDGDDYYDGGEGDDTYTLALTGADAEIDLHRGEASSADIGRDELVSIENVVGGEGDDTITGNEAANELTGGDGDDVLEGGGGDDDFFATSGDGDDQYDGGEGSDSYSLAGTSADAVIDLAGGEASSDDTGHDDLTSIENAVGGSGNDIIIASGAVNLLSGGDGDDIFVFNRESGDNSGHGSSNSGHGSGNSGHGSGNSGHGHGRGHRDVIDDFAVGDILDLSGFTGDLEDDGWQRLTFIYDEAEFDGVGQIRFDYETFEDQEYTIVEIRIRLDVDGDDEPDFEIELYGRQELDVDNVLL